MIYRAISLTLVAYVAVRLGSWWNDVEPPVIVFHRGATDDVVVPGGTLVLAYNVQRRRICRTKIDSFIYDSQSVRYTLPKIEYVASPGPLGNQEFKTNIQIPEKAEPGMARYVTTSEYVCNPLHNISPIIIGPTETRFMISPKEQGTRSSSSGENRPVARE